MFILQSKNLRVKILIMAYQREARTINYGPKDSYLRI